jgi:hypothetical protein
MKFIKILVLAVLFVLVIALIIQNQGVFTETFDLILDLNFYQIGPYVTSNLVLIGGAFLMGVIFAVIWGAFYSVSSRTQLKEKDRRIRELEKRNNELERQMEEVRISPSMSPSPLVDPAQEEVKKEENKSPFSA